MISLLADRFSNKNLTLFLRTKLSDPYRETGIVKHVLAYLKVVFIPQVGKINHSTVKDFSTISLSSVLLSIMERIIDYKISSLFTYLDISKSQHAYMKGRSDHLGYFVSVMINSRVTVSRIGNSNARICVKRFSHHYQS